MIHFEVMTGKGLQRWHVVVMVKAVGSLQEITLKTMDYPPNLFTDPFVSGHRNYIDNILCVSVSNKTIFFCVFLTSFTATLSSSYHPNRRSNNFSALRICEFKRPHTWVRRLVSVLLNRLQKECGTKWVSVFPSWCDSLFVHCWG